MLHNGHGVDRCSEGGRLLRKALWRGKMQGLRRMRHPLLCALLVERYRDIVERRELCCRQIGMHHSGPSVITAISGPFACMSCSNVFMFVSCVWRMRWDSCLLQMNRCVRAYRSLRRSYPRRIWKVPGWKINLVFGWRDSHAATSSCRLSPASPTDEKYSQGVLAGMSGSE